MLKGLPNGKGKKMRESRPKGCCKSQKAATAVKLGADTGGKLIYAS
jgi:hypothetical protein